MSQTMLYACYQCYISVMANWCVMAHYCGVVRASMCGKHISEREDCQNFATVFFF